MVHYRRARTPGGAYFFTVALQDRRAATLVDHVAVLRNAFRKTRSARPFRSEAVVVLPDHLHAIWTLPDGDADYSGRWRMIKAHFVRDLRKEGVPVHSNQRGECNVWQRRFWEHKIRDEEDFVRHVDYIHMNPVNHGLVRRVADWPWSSFHRFVRAGLLPRDWATDVLTPEGFGE